MDASRVGHLSAISARLETGNDQFKSTDSRGKTHGIIAGD